MKNSSRNSRRNFLIQGTSTLAALAFFESPLFSEAWGARQGEKMIPFLDQPPAPKKKRVLLNWQELKSWITPNDQFFKVSHYNKPVIRAEDWRLDLDGWIERPRKFTLDEIKARPRKEVTFTVECSGNHGFPSFVGAIGNAKWAGTPLAPILKETGIKTRGIEVVFFGNDEGEEEVRGIKMKQSFSRSMSVNEAMDPEILLCYEMNGKPLPHENGYPLRLIAPGWYGIANVKWLERIQVIDTRWAGRFMAKDYVTIREEQDKSGKTFWTQKVVGRSLIKSATAKVTVKDGQYRIYGAAWGTPIKDVEVRVDEGHWRKATIDRGQGHEFAWKFWHLDWSEAKVGEHTITSRAIDRDGNIQPTVDDPRIAKKRTYWESNGQITRRIKIS